MTLLFKFGTYSVIDVTSSAAWKSSLESPLFTDFLSFLNMETIILWYWFVAFSERWNCKKFKMCNHVDVLHSFTPRRAGGVHFSTEKWWLFSQISHRWLRHKWWSCKGWVRVRKVYAKHQTLFFGWGIKSIDAEKFILSLWFFKIENHTTLDLSFDAQRLVGGSENKVSLTLSVHISIFDCPLSP